MKASIIAFFIMITGCARAQIVNSGNLQLHTGSNVTILGDFTNNGTFTDSGSVVLLNGSLQQHISGSVAATFRNLTVNNAAGVQLQQSTSISGVLNLNSGPFDLNSRSLTILTGLTGAITRSSGYIVSEKTNNSSVIIWQIGSVTGNHIFPMGTESGSYIPFMLNLSSGNIGSVSLATYPTAANNTPYPSTPVAVTHMFDSLGNDNSSNAADRFWNISKTGPGGVATLTFKVTATEAGTIGALVAQRWNETTQGWDEPLPGQTAGATSATVPSVSQFSVWVLSAEGHPLPVELMSFNAVQHDHSVDIFWLTASENNTDYFVVERSDDGFGFEGLTQHDAAGYSNELLSYKVIDENPLNGLSWYRLKTVDFSGEARYSIPAPVYFQVAETADIVVFPVPAKAGQLTVNLINFVEGPCMIEITDAGGRTEFLAEYSVTPVQNTIQISEKLSPGPKTIRVINAGHAFTKQLIILE